MSKTNIVCTVTWFNVFLNDKITSILLFISNNFDLVNNVIQYPNYLSTFSSETNLLNSRMQACTYVQVFQSKNITFTIAFTCSRHYLSQVRTTSVCSPEGKSPEFLIFDLRTVREFQASPASPIL